MDERDFQILVDLMRDPTLSYEALGRRIGLSGMSTKTRLEHMLREGPLRGFVGMPRAIAFDRTADVLWASPSPAARQRLEEVLAVRDVVWVSLLHTGDVAVMVYMTNHPPRGELEGILEAPLRSAGGYGTWAGDIEDAELSILDWRLVRHLVREPRLSIAQLVERTGLSRNTVRKRRARLFEARLVTLFPLLETAQASGLMLYNMVVDVDAPEALNDVQEALPHAALLVRHDLGRLQGATYMGHADSLADVTTAHAQLERMPGVRKAQLVVDMRRMFATKRVEGWVDQRIAAKPA